MHSRLCTIGSSSSRPTTWTTTTAFSTAAATITARTPRSNQCHEMIDGATQFTCQRSDGNSVTLGRTMIIGPIASKPATSDTAASAARPASFYSGQPSSTSYPCTSRFDSFSRATPSTIHVTRALLVRYVDCCAQPDQDGPGPVKRIQSKEGGGRNGSQGTPGE